MDALLSFLDSGLLDLNWWQLILAALVLTHITIAGVTIFLHRCQAHRALELHAIPSHFFRFWLWLTTGMVTKEWAAIHRKHHAKCEREGDPHSPKVYGLKKVLFEGAELYRTESKNQETLRKYGHGTPDDWIERNLYTKHSAMGVVLMLFINLALFGVIGVSIWAVQMMWIPVTAAGIINGLGHAIGYRNFDCEDASTNLVPWGILIGGEELHNNHHAYGTSAKLSNRWYEFDIGWMYITLLRYMGLVKVRKVAPTLKLVNRRAAKPQADSETLQSVIALRYELMGDFARTLRNACSEEVERLKSVKSDDVQLLKSARGWLHLDSEKWTGEQQAKLKDIFEASSKVEYLIQMRQDLASVWERSNSSTEHLVQRLQQWCENAEASGVTALREMAQRMRRFAPITTA